MARKDGERPARLAEPGGRRERGGRRRSERGPEPSLGPPDPSEEAPSAPEALSRVPKTERILNLIAFLLRCREPVSLETILEKVNGYDDGVQRESLNRRFERDKKVLRDMGVPLHYCSGGSGPEGYIIPRDSYFLDEITLPVPSLALLRALAAALSRGPEGGMRDDLRSALLKLGFDAGRPSPEVIAAAQKSLSGQVLDLKLDASEHLETLGQAVLLRRRVRITYYTIGRDATEEREVDPYGLGFSGQGWHKGAWYLVGFCHKRQAIRVFKLARLRGAVSLVLPREDGPDFELPAGFRVAHHLARPLWEIQDLEAAVRASGQPGALLEARVRVERGASSEILELAPSARVLSSEPGSVTLAFPVRARRPFLRFLLRYQGHIEVIAPAELKEELAALARDILARYGEEA